MSSFMTRISAARVLSYAEAGLWCASKKNKTGV